MLLKGVGVGVVVVVDEEEIAMDCGLILSFLEVGIGSLFNLDNIGDELNIIYVLNDGCVWIMDRNKRWIIKE